MRRKLCALAVVRRTDEQTNKHTNKHTDRGDYNTLRSLARSVTTAKTYVCVCVWAVAVSPK